MALKCVARGLNYPPLCCQFLLSSIAESNEITTPSYKEHNQWQLIYVAKIEG